MSRITSDMKGYHCSSSRSTNIKYVYIKLQYKGFRYYTSCTLLGCDEFPFMCVLKKKIIEDRPLTVRK